MTHPCKIYLNTRTSEAYIEVGGVKLHGIAGITMDTVATIHLLDGNQLLLRPNGDREYVQNSFLNQKQVDIIFASAVKAIGGLT